MFQMSLRRRGRALTILAEVAYSDAGGNALWTRTVSVSGSAARPDVAPCVPSHATTT